MFNKLEKDDINILSKRAKDAVSHVSIKKEDLLALIKEIKESRKKK
jgi:hypothetical protein